MTVTERLGDFLLFRTSRRSFLAKTTMTATALSVAPVDFVLHPGTAYAQICQCTPYNQCDCSSLCCSGYTQFCCTINGGINACPPGTFAGGWWKADGSIYCAGPRYYIDCHGECHGCGCGSGSFCPSCDGLTCECAQGNCSYWYVGCNEFRYGQCNMQVSCSGRIACRVISCTPPWALGYDCSTTTYTDDSTADHYATCQNGPTGYPPPPPPPPKMEDDAMFVAELQGVGFYLVSANGKLGIPTIGDVEALLEILNQKSPVTLSADLYRALPDWTT